MQDMHEAKGRARLGIVAMVTSRKAADRNFLVFAENPYM